MLDDTGLGTIFTMGKHVEDASIIKTMQDTPEIKDKRLEAVFGKDSFVSLKFSKISRIEGSVLILNFLSDLDATGTSKRDCPCRDRALFIGPMSSSNQPLHGWKKDGASHELPP